MKSRWLILKDGISAVFSECGSTFNVPASNAEIERYEKNTGVLLPSYLRELYLSFNGQHQFGEICDENGNVDSYGRNVCFLAAYRIMPLEEAEQHFKYMVMHLRNNEISEGEANEELSFWSRQYFLFAEYNGEWLAVDLRSEEGKILHVDAGGLIDSTDERFPSIKAMPELYIEKIKKNEFVINRGFMYVNA